MLGGLSSGSLLLGSGAFSSARAERNVNVSVAEDDEALVGYSSEDRTVPMDLTDDGRVPLVTVTNQFAESVSVTAEIVEGADYFSDVDDLEILSGESKTVTGDINLGSGQTDLDSGERTDISVSLDVDGAGVSAEVFGDTETRQFTIEHSEKAVDSLKFIGDRKAKVEQATEEYSVYLLFGDTSGSELQNQLTIPGEWNDDKISPEGSDNSEVKNRNLFAVKFTDLNMAFYRESCGLDKTEIPWNMPILSGQEQDSSCN